MCSVMSCGRGDFSPGVSRSRAPPPKKKAHTLLKHFILQNVSCPNKRNESNQLVSRNILC
jgi:hypothetical protein